MRTRSILPLLLLAACAPAVTRSPVPVRDPESLIAAMHDHYGGSWYSSLSYRQRTTILAGGSTQVQTWRVLEARGRMRIETDPYATGGMIFNGDSVFVIRDRELAESHPASNVLLLVTTGVYRQPVDRTLSELSRAGFLPGALRADSWQGRPAWVMSATTPAGRVREIWVDARRLLPVRLVEPLPGGSTREVRLADYRAHGTGWLAHRIEVREDGRPVELAEIGSVRHNSGTMDSEFDPEQWKIPVQLNAYSRGNYIDASDIGHSVSYH
jgi:hypothetical protein